jgi:hypothetical protein
VERFPSILACLVLAALLSPGSAVAWNEPDAFRGIPWGVSSEQARRICAANGEELGCYENVCKAWGDIGPVRSQITYEFTDDKLTSVILRFQSRDYSAMRNLFTEQYGRPTGESEDQFRTETRPQVTTQTLTWKGGKVVIYLGTILGPIDEGHAMLRLREDLDRAVQEAKEKRRKKE